MADISQITLPDGTTYDIKDPVARAAASDAGGGGIFYGTCDTAAATQTKVATIEDFELFTGVMVAIKFDNVNTATSPKLNISGLGAKNIYSVGTTTVLPYAWKAGEVVLFTYNGTAFVVVDGGVASTTEYGVTKLNSSTSSTSTTEAATPSAVKSAYDLAATANNSIPDVSGKLDKSGGTMTGALVLASDPTADLQAATKKYVDDNSLPADISLYNWVRYTYEWDSYTYLAQKDGFSYDYSSSSNYYYYMGPSSSSYTPYTVVSYSSSITINNSGTISLVSPTSLTLKATSDLSTLNTKYFKITTLGKTGYINTKFDRQTIYYVSSVATTTNSNKLCLKRDGLNVVHSYKVCDSSSKEFLTSNNRNQYPDDSWTYPYRYFYTGVKSTGIMRGINVETSVVNSNGTTANMYNPVVVQFNGIPLWVELNYNQYTSVASQDYTMNNPSAILTDEFATWFLLREGSFSASTVEIKIRRVGNTIEIYPFYSDFNGLTVMAITVPSL